MGVMVVDSGVVAASKPNSAYASNAFACACVLDNGRWLCVWRAAPRKSATIDQHVLVSWSDDAGRTWREPIEPFSSLPDVNGVPGVCRAAAFTPLGGNRVLATLYWVDHSQPSRPFFNETTNGLLNSHIFTAISDDAGVTWSEPRYLDKQPFDCPTPITGPILLLPDGRWACQFELNKHYEEIAPWEHRSVMMFSSDRGATWPQHAITSSDPENRVFYWDQRPSVLANGTMMNAFWTFDTQTSKYLSIHTRVSHDGGQSWSDYHDTLVSGQPAPIISLSGDRLGMVYVDRTLAPAIKMRVSQDHGRSWPDESELIIHQAMTLPPRETRANMNDAWEEMSKFSIGLPSTYRLSDNEVLVAFYAGDGPDQTSIRWARVRFQT
jgi:hypothetical protein